MTLVSSKKSFHSMVAMRRRLRMELMTRVSASGPVSSETGLSSFHRAGSGSGVPFQFGDLCQSIGKSFQDGQAEQKR